RCPPSILAAGERLLEATQPERRARRPAGDRGEAPFAVDVSWEADAAQEALHVARRIREHMLSSRGRLRPADFAILLRSTSALSAPFEQALRALGIPFEVRGLGALARNEVVRFLLSYLAALARPDDPEALAHLLASGLSGAGRRVVSRLHAHAAEAGRPLGKVVNSLMYRLAERDPERFPLPWPAAAGGPGVGLELRTAGAEGDGPDAPAPPAYLEFLTDGELDGLHRAVTCYQRLRGQSGRLPLAALAYAVLEDAGVLARVLSSSRLPEAERTRGLADVRAALAAFEEVDQVWRRLLGGAPRLAELADSLESIVSRAVDETEAIPGAGDSVQILTVHQSKGLEFEVVFLAGFADGVFPVRAKPHPLLDEVEMAWLEANLPDFRPPWPSAAAGRLAEEARLAYVGMTRARSHLHLTYAAQYLAASGPSPFLEMALPGGEHHGPGVAVQLEPGEILTRTEAETLAARFCDDLGKGDLDALARRGCDRDFIADPRSGQAFLPYLGVRPEGVAPHHFSATDLTAYLKCPRLYWYGHHPGLVAAPRSPEMTRGGFLHKVLEEFHRREAEWRGLTAGDRREWLEKAILAHLEPYLGRVEPTLDRRREELEVRKILDNYLRFATIPQKVPRRGTLATEKRFTLVLEGAEIHGIIDRINDTGAGTCEVVDYKTGRGLTARRAYQTYFGDDPHDVQLAVYYLACREGADVDGTPLALEPRFISLWYPKDLVYGTMRQVIFAVGEPAGLKAWMEQPLTADDLERGRATVTGAIEHVRQGDFEPRPREAPGTCMSFTGCPHEGICPFARTAAE
ncbi:MAG: PD-(D/E)XK nuclease family protein, partial [Candidatus Dormibacteraceae bacterium]